MSFQSDTGFRYTRLYADGDGQTHFEDVLVPAVEDGLVTVSEAIPLSAMIMRHVVHAPGDAVRHNAPRRQFIVHLEGTVEVEASDGERRRFGPGDVVLVEDTEGDGHVTHWLGEDAGRRVLFLTLPTPITSGRGADPAGGRPVPSLRPRGRSWRSA